MAIAHAALEQSADSGSKEGFHAMFMFVVISILTVRPSLNLPLPPPYPFPQGLGVSCFLSFFLSLALFQEIRPMSQERWGHSEIFKRLLLGQDEIGGILLREAGYTSPPHPPLPRHSNLRCRKGSFELEWWWNAKPPF